MGFWIDLKKLRQRNGRQRRLLLEAMAWLGIMRVAVWLFPFRRFFRWLKLDQGEAGPAEVAEPCVVEIGWAIAAAAARAPWRSTCLVKAFCGARMLGRRGIPFSLWFGVAKGEPGRNLLNAHAWLRSGSQTVSGKQESARFKPLAVFHLRVNP